MSLPPDPAEGRVADAELLYGAVMGSVRHAVWVATGGSDGCALCDGLTFKERIARGPRHYDCAQALAVTKGAGGVAESLSCGSLMAALMNGVSDPRLGEWKRHLDEWSER